MTIALELAHGNLYICGYIFIKSYKNRLKLGIIGEPCIDFIHREGMDTKKHFGGILYSVVSLAVIAGKDEIYPIMNLGSDEYVNVRSFLSKFNNIKTDFIYRCSHKTRVVNLYYKSGNTGSKTNARTYDREENSTEPTLALDIEQLNKPLNIMDSIFINMVSGTDISFASLQSIRRIFHGYIHMDLHNVVMKTNKNGTRTRGPVKKWMTWCSNSDSLQMNEAEISVLSPEKSSEKETAEKIINSGSIRTLIITRGKKGVSIYEPKKNDEPGAVKTDYPAIITPDFKDSTGCGDVFGSAFFYKLSVEKSGDTEGAVSFASRLASRNAELAGVEELDKLIE